MGRILAEHMTFSVADDTEVRLVVFVPATEANSISKMRKVIGAFHNGARRSRIRMDIISQ